MDDEQMYESACDCPWNQSTDLDWDAAQAAAERREWAARDAEYEASKTPGHRAAEAARPRLTIVPFSVTGVTLDDFGQYVGPASTAAEIAAEAAASLDRQAEQRELVRHMATMD